jgi:linoleoyl-CoA desaturase
VGELVVIFFKLAYRLGFTLAIVFQLAHVVEETTFEFAPTDETTRIENEWAIHQVKTTSNFSLTVVSFHGLWAD